MRITDGKPAPFGEELRRAGEIRVQSWNREIPLPTVEQLQCAIQELHIYEAELEIQNEELIQSRRTIEEAQKRYFRHFDLAPVGLIRLNGYGQIMEANVLGAQMLGMDRIQTQNFRRTMLACVAPNSMEVFQQHLGDALASGKLETSELMLKSPAGATRFVRVQSVSNPNEDGTCDLYVSVTDLSDRRQAEEELIAQKEIADSTRIAAEAASLNREQFFAMLTHELRTPLTPVLALLGDLEAVRDRPLEECAALSTMRRNLEMEVHLIEDLLDLVRISNGKLSCKREPTDMHLCIEKALDVCRAEIGAKGLHLEVKLDAVRYFADADKRRIKQVLWNLLQNATKFTPPGGLIGIRTSNTPAQRFIVEVYDSGIGIDASLLRNVFDAFNQGSRATTAQHGGLGLGLSIARSIVEAHEGYLTVTSPGVGKGTTFRLDLETIESPSGDGRNPVVHEEGRARRKGVRLLLVEDHTDIRNSLQRGLCRYGYSVEVAADAATACARCAEHHFDLLIIDLGLPDLNGYALFEQLSRDYPLRGIAISGYSEGEDQARSAAVGFLEHLVKPFGLQELDAAIQRAIVAAPPLFQTCKVPENLTGNKGNRAGLVADHFSHAYRFALCMTLIHAEAAALIEAVASTMYHEGGGVIDADHLDRVSLFAALYDRWLSESLGSGAKPESPALIREIIRNRIHPQASDHTAMQKIVHSMPVELRVTLALFYFEQLTHTEIMQILKLPSGVVRSRLDEANRLLQQHLAEKKLHF